MKLALKLPPPEGNLLEQAFSLHLQSMLQTGEIQWWKYQPLRLRIGRNKSGKAAYYKPDHGALTAEGEFILYEVKGFWREAARVRIRVAAELFPFFRFIAATRQDGAWEREEF